MFLTIKTSAVIISISHVRASLAFAAQTNK
jgi:hypothetical protein